MNFKKADKYYEASDCGRYTVCAHIQGGERVVYFAYRRSAILGRPAELLGRFDVAEQARERCRAVAQEAAT